MQAWHCATTAPCSEEVPMFGNTLQKLFRALRSRNYKLFFGGQAVSLTGYWMQRVAMSWLVYRITGSPMALGIVDFVGQIPTLFLGFFAGTLLDRWDLRRVVIVCQTISMGHAFLLAALTLSGVVEYWHVVALSAVLGVVNAFELPARLSFVVHLVDDPEDLSNAIALNSTLFNGARLVGPSLAGVVIAMLGEGLCFLANGLSYLATLVALLSVHLARPARAEKRPGRVLEETREGWNYAMNFLPIRTILFSVASISFFGLPYLILLPVFAGDILQGGPQTLGFLTAASGIGALFGSCRMALRTTPVGLSLVIARTMALFGTAVAAFAFSRMVPLSMLLMAPIGFSMVVTFIACNTLLQTLVEDDKRSRVMSLYNMAVSGIAPLGSFCAGWSASLVGAPTTQAVGGLASVITAVLLWRSLPSLRRWAHPILVAKGFLPPEAS